MIHLTFYVCRGLPASGKSTWAESMIALYDAGDVARVNRDLIRTMLHGGRFNGQVTEALVVAVRDAALREAMARKVPHVISDDTNLPDDVFNELVRMGESFGYEVLCKDFRDVRPEVCIERNAKRERKVPEGAIIEMWRTYIQQPGTGGLAVE